MRTDSNMMAPEAVQETRKAITQHYGDRYLAQSVRVYKSKARNAQEAHEAIRPTQLLRLPETLAAQLSSEQLKLYTLIWSRAMASQMSSALFDNKLNTKDTIQKKKHPFKATGSVCTFPGFLKAYQDSAEQNQDTPLPEGLKKI